MDNIIKNTLNKISNGIKRAIVSLVSSDNGVFQVAQISYLGKTANAELIYPYGLSSNPPVGSIAVIFNVQGQEENRVGIANYPGARFKNLKAGEVALGNFITKSNIKFLESGDIVVTSMNDMQVIISQNNTVSIGGGCAVNITSNATVNIGGSATITCPTSTVHGDVTINGNLAVNGDSISTGNFTTSGDVVASGISLATHVHGGVESGGDTTNPPS